MKILLTGATGFIGKNISEYLINSGRHELFAPSSSELNLLDEMSVDPYLRKHQFDVIIHTAGKPGHRNAADPTGVFYADTRMYFNIVRNHDCFGKLIITGSGGIYDLRNYRPKMKETEWKNNIPSDEHGFFRYVTAHHIETMDRIVDLRLFGVFGKYEDYLIRFISNAICKTLYDLPITIRQDRFFDYLYIDDLMQVIDFFITNDALYNEYNITPDKPVSLKWLAELILSVSGKHLPILIASEGFGSEYSGDNSRLKEQIPKMSFTSFETAITSMVHWYRQNLSNIDKFSLLTDK